MSLRRAILFSIGGILILSALFWFAADSDARAQRLAAARLTDSVTVSDQLRYITDEMAGTAVGPPPDGHAREHAVEAEQRPIPYMLFLGGLGFLAVIIGIAIPSERGREE